MSSLILGEGFLGIHRRSSLPGETVKSLQFSPVHGVPWTVVILGVLVPVEIFQSPEVYGVPDITPARVDGLLV